MTAKLIINLKIMYMENYTGLMLFALVAGVFAALGFYLGRIYQNYLINKAKTSLRKTII